MTLLRAMDVTMRFGGLTALDGVSFDVREGEVLGLIGPNGAGKSTCFNVITGALKPTSGRLLFRGEDVTGAKPHQIARLGIVRSFQQTAVFGALTVAENVRTGCYLQSNALQLGRLFNRRRRQAPPVVDIEAVTERILDETGLSAVAEVGASALPYGHLRRLGVAIALAARPAVLLLDEPAAGLNPTESAEFVRLVRTIRDHGVTVMLVEHDMKVVMGLCDRLVVLNYGKKLVEGDPQSVRANEEVIRSYLGVRRNAQRTQ